MKKLFTYFIVVSVGLGTHFPGRNDFIIFHIAVAATQFRHIYEGKEMAAARSVSVTGCEKYFFVYHSTVPKPCI